jgi:hypothetical protein
MFFEWQNGNGILMKNRNFFAIVLPFAILPLAWQWQ